MSLLKKENSIPEYGLKLKLNHEYPENRKQKSFFSFKSFWLNPWMKIRYIIYYIFYKICGNFVCIDFINHCRSKRIYGVPIGGIGCGTIGRGYKGEFCRFQMKPGMYEFEVIEANQFIVTIKDKKDNTIFHSLLSTFPRKNLKCWKSLIDGEKCKYTALYPRSWTEYDLSEYGIKLICRQISPIIPHNYKDSSLPCAVFVWTIENHCEEKRKVSITFTFKNGTGNKNEDTASKSYSEAFKLGNIEGVQLHHTISGTPCTYILSAEKQKNQEISKCLYFNPNSDGSELWYQLENEGKFKENLENSKYYKEMACGISIKTIIGPNEIEEIKTSLIWNMPIVNFGPKSENYERKYTEFFQNENLNQELTKYVHENYENWEKEIYRWQIEILNDKKIPDWFKSALFNQTYYISDGGGIWLTLKEEEKDKLPENDPRRIYGRFAYLESQDYKMYNSYDVHFYASIAFNMNWPEIENIMNYDMRDVIFLEVPEKRIMLNDGNFAKRKIKNTIPHDLGNPSDRPFILPNSFIFQDTSKWKDLNSKFVLQIFRDIHLPNGKINESYLKDMYDSCYIVTMDLFKYDRDGDFLIENDGIADQTYDTWRMEGPSAYCGGLWLACLFAMSEMAKFLGKEDDFKKFREMLNRGKAEFQELLWNGSYYNFDCSKLQKSCIMADQLCGHWYLRCIGCKYEVFPEENVKKALQTILKNNVKQFCNGELGAVNGFINGKTDASTLFSREVWTGVTYSLASTMIFEGMIGEGFATAEGLFNTITNKFGLSFDYPEAVQSEIYYRGLGYSRPLSIWSIFLAYKKIISEN